MAGTSGTRHRMGRRCKCWSMRKMCCIGNKWWLSPMLVRSMSSSCCRRCSCSTILTALIPHCTLDTYSYLSHRIACTYCRRMRNSSHQQSWATVSMLHCRFGILPHCLNSRSNRETCTVYKYCLPVIMGRYKRCSL